MNSANKLKAKDIAFKVITKFSNVKKIQNNHILAYIKDYTDDENLIKDSYNQVRRALNKLGFTDNGKTT
jgi:hypothetical protein